MLPVYRTALDRGLPSPSATTVRINQALDQGDFELAKKLLPTLQADDPETTYMEGVVLVAIASFAPARAALEESIRQGPSFAGSERAFYFLGISLLRLGEGKAAREALLAHQQIHPQAAMTSTALGDLAQQEGDSTTALAHYRQAISLFEAQAQTGVVSRAAYALAHSGVSDALMQQGDAKGALQALRSSLEMDPSQAETWYKLSQIQMQLGMQTDAAKSFREFARLGGVK